MNSFVYINIHFILSPVTDVYSISISNMDLFIQYFKNTHKTNMKCCL